MVFNHGSLVAVTEKEFTFKLRISSDMSPEIQVVAYAILPSQGVIAHSANFPTEKCFSHDVSLQPIKETWQPEWVRS